MKYSFLQRFNNHLAPCAIAYDCENDNNARKIACVMMKNDSKISLVEIRKYSHTETKWDGSQDIYTPFQTIKSEEANTLLTQLRKDKK